MSLTTILRIFGYEGSKFKLKKLNCESYFKILLEEKYNVIRLKLPDWNINKYFVEIIGAALLWQWRSKAKPYCRCVEQTPLIKFYYSVCERSNSRTRAKKQSNKKNSLMFWFFLTGSVLIDVSVPGKADSLIVLYSLSLSTNTIARILWKLQKRELKMRSRVGHLFACYFGKNWPPPRLIIYNEYNFIKWH